MYKKIFLGVLLFLALISWEFKARAEPTLPNGNYVDAKSYLQPQIGDALGFSQNNKVALITKQGAEWTASAMWSSYKISTKRDFKISGLVYINSINTPGDGITITFANDPRIVTNYSTMFSRLAGGNGVYGVVNNTISFEMDTWVQANNPNSWDSDIDQGKGNGHVAFNVNGNKHFATSYPSTPLARSTWHSFEINFNASTKTFSYTFDGVLTGSYISTNLETILNGDTFYFGFTGLNGGANQDAAIALSEIPQSKKITSSIKNKTLGGSFSQSTTVQRNQIASFNSDFFIGGPNYVEGSPKVRLNLPKGKLSYVNNTLFIDGVQVPSSKIITETDGTLTIDVADYVSSGSFGFNLTMDATVITVGGATDENIQLNYSFIDNTTNILSNNIFAIIPKAKKVTIKSLDKDTNASIATDQVVLGATGESLNITPPTVNNFVFSDATPSSSITFTEADQIVSLYYYKRELRFINVPSVMNFGNVKIGNTNRESFATVSNAAGVSIRDTRSGGNWSLSVKQSQELIDPLTSKKMQNIFFKNGSSENQLSTSAFLTIYNGQSDNVTFNKHIFWGTNQGFFTKIRPSDYVGHYQGKVEWLLSDTP